MTDRLPDDELVLPPGAPPDVDSKLVAALERIGQALRVQTWDKAKRHGLSPTQLQLLLRLLLQRCLPARHHGPVLRLGRRHMCCVQWDDELLLPGWERAAAAV